MDTEKIIEISSEIAFNVNQSLIEDRPERMKQFYDADGKITEGGLLAFAISDTQLFTTRYTTALLVRLSQEGELK